LIYFYHKNRLYGENHQKNSNILLKDIVVSAIMSDNMLGPKLYGLFQYGRLEEFINVIIGYLSIIILLIIKLNISM
jgi:hypothetical protein